MERERETERRGVVRIGLRYWKYRIRIQAKTKYRRTCRLSVRRWINYYI